MPKPLILSCVALLLLQAAAHVQPPAKTKLLYDFEDAADRKAWANLVLPAAKDKEPPIQIELSPEHATFGKQSLKLTFNGGTWPTVSTTQVGEDWLAYPIFEADVFAPRPCLIGFTVIQEKSARGTGWDALISRWTKTAFLQPGMNHVKGIVPQPNQYALHAKWGKVLRFEIFMYAPHQGESIYVDNIRLTSEKARPKEKKQFTVAGTDWVLSGESSANAVIELGKKFKAGWTKPTPKTLDQVEGEFRAQFAELKKKHPRAVIAVLRDGEKGYDAAHPEKAFAGWRDAYFTSHGPDSNYLERAANRGKSATHELFMRHRSPLMRVDLSSIPHGANILAAKLVVIRANEKYLDDHNPEAKPTMWVVEPCNRSWVEHEANAFEYAKDKFWKNVGGAVGGQDADFEPIFLAYGPGRGKVNIWDFAEAVRYWTNGKHANHGFMLHGDSHDYITGWSREAPEMRNRPAVLVVYEASR
jgi:hypothetical protein